MLDAAAAASQSWLSFSNSLSPSSHIINSSNYLDQIESSILNIIHYADGFTLEFKNNILWNAIFLHMKKLRQERLNKMSKVT